MRTFEIRVVNVDGENKERPVDIATGRVYGSKSQVAGYIFDEVIANEAIETKYQRAAFIERCQAELDMSTNGASTYFYNKRKKAAGGNEYQHNINSAAKKKAMQAEAQPEAAPVVVEEEKGRWRVVLKDTRSLLKSFTTRTAAQTFNKEQKKSGLETVMVDAEKVAA